MDDDPKPSDPKPPEPPPASPPGAGADPPPFSQNTEGYWQDGDGNRVFTKEQFDSGMAAARRDGEDRARSKQKPTPTPKPKAKTTAPTPPPSTRDATARTLDFRDAITDFGVERPKRRQIEQMYLSSGEDDPDAWLESHGGLFGLAQPQPPGSEPTPAPKAAPVEPQPPKGEPVEPPKPAPRVEGAPGKVSPLDTSTGLIDVFSLSEEDHDRLGPEKIVEHYERALAAADRADGRPARPRALRQATK